MSILEVKKSPLAVDVRFDAQTMHVRLNDGREIGVPLEWYPRLRGASKRERERWRLIGRGIGIHWDALDEDLSTEGLLS